MKVTLEVPDLLLRRAKSLAAWHYAISTCTEAVQEKLNVTSNPAQKPWMKHLGKLKSLHTETARIDKRIEEAFEQIDCGKSPYRKRKVKE